FSSRRRHTRFSRDWSSDVCSSDLDVLPGDEHGPSRAAVWPAGEDVEHMTVGGERLQRAVVPVIPDLRWVHALKGLAPLAGEHDQIGRASWRETVWKQGGAA